MERRQARALLYEPDGTPTKKYRAYQKYRTEYLQNIAALEEGEKHRRSGQRGALAPMSNAVLRRRADRALVRWNAIGHRAEVERALASLRGPGRPVGA